jgi:hypothetical protein
MTAIAAYTLLVGPAAKGRGGQARGVEKTKARRQFDGEYATGQPAHTCVARHSAASAPCQYGTDDDASFWNGPRLMPVFAAQVLAQAMNKPRAQDPSAYVAYRGRAVRSALLFDENL